MTKDITRYEWMWTTHRSRFVLLRGNHGIHVPFNTETSYMTVIENDSVAAAVVEKMLETGIPLVDEPPS